MKSEETSPPDQIGRYQVRKSLGRGGMGEVYLCWDPHFHRQVAVKRIRPHLVEQPRIRHRFLREARIAGQLSHPSIIPVFELHEGHEPFYVMPFLSGKTFRAVLQTPAQDAPPIPSLLRVFLQICQAVAYSHSRGILHRDLKPENVIVGDFGEVVLLDWGLAKTHHEVEISAELPDVDPQVTSLGKIVGTLAYMAPERTLQQPATVQTEIYALGVMLYQILCLRLPFRRKSFKEFRKSVHRERFEDPAKIAPLREVPAQLVRIVKRCLHPIPSRRYASVEALLCDIETVLEGRSDWFPIAELSMHNKSDWEFQEHIWLAPMAGLSSLEPSEWVGLMISKGSFSGNIRLETLVRLKPNGQGIGFLLSVPEAAERLYPDDGYLIWLGGAHHPGFRLYRRHALVAERQELSLPYDRWQRLVIEKIDNAIRLSLDDQPILSYLSHLPLHGTHIGILHRDGDFDLSHLKIAAGNSSVVQSCLALPDAFLSYGEYARALAEYRRIAYSFPERSEGREAIFRAGLTLIEKARHIAHPAQQEALQNQALHEFERLHNTPSAPLEYLGKSLLAQSQGELEEEVQYLELGLRRFGDHPLRVVLEEQIHHRLAELARSSRPGAALFLALVLRLLPDCAGRPSVQTLLHHLQIHFPLPFPGPSDGLIEVESMLCQAERIAQVALQPEGAVALVLLNRIDLLPLAQSALHSGHRSPLEEETLHPWVRTLSSLVSSALAPSLDLCKQQFLGLSAEESYCLWRSLLRRAQDQAWTLIEPPLESHAEHWSPEQRRQALEQELWLALALHEMEIAQKKREALAHYPDTLDLRLLQACWLLRLGLSSQAADLLKDSLTHRVVQTLPATHPSLLAWHSLTDSLTENVWNRALPLEQREALRWIRLFAVCSGDHSRVDTIQRALESRSWSMPARLAPGCG